MRPLAHRGFTLIELMVALVLLGIVTTGIYKVLVNNQRIYMAQTQQIDLQQNIRAAVAILPAELREMSAAEGDITAMGPDSITFRAMRKIGFICAPAPQLGGGVGNITVLVRQNPAFGRNLPFQDNDSALVYWEGNPTDRNDDQWLAARVTQASAGNCVDNNATPPAWALTMSPAWLGAVDANGRPIYNIAGTITAGSPVRGFSNVTYKLYRSSSDTSWYLGMRNNEKSNPSLNPIVGPLSGPAGLEFDYFDVNDARITDFSDAGRRRVAQIEIHVRARTAAPVGGGTSGRAYKVDSVTTRVALRGNPRCGLGAPANCL